MAQPNHMTRRQLHVAYRSVAMLDIAHLVLGVLGELEVDTLAGQALVDLGVGIKTVVDAATLLLVEDDLEDLGVVLLGADALADDLDGVDEVGEDGVVDGGQGPGDGTLLGLGGAAAVAALGAGQDAAGSDDQHVAIRELLLELTGEAGCSVSGGFARCESMFEEYLPLLGTVPALEKRDRDEDDDSLLAVASLDL
jgi:hypothetical protein